MLISYCQGLGRFIDLFDNIKDEVSEMTTQLKRLTMYEDLYGRSVDMQDQLFKSYQNVFRFWCRVDKECSRRSKFDTLAVAFD